MNETRALPTGTVTFLFTDIEGSTPLLQRFPQAMPDALARHHAILQNAIDTHNGHTFQIIGDAFCAAFANASDALETALTAQRGLRDEAWGETGVLRVRMGLYTGEAEARGDDYVSSLTLVRVQRLMSAGHGGQILLSTTTADAVRADLRQGIVLRDLGLYRLRGLTLPERILQVCATDLPDEFAPLRATNAAEFDREPISLLDKLVRGKIIGRAREIEQLQQRWRLAQQGSAQLVLLSGEPGVGKTRLAQEAMAMARADRAVILRGGCYEYEATTPYLPFVEALRDWVHAQSPAQLGNALGATAPEIAKLAPEIESKLTGLALNAPLSPHEERLRLFDNVARLVQSLAAANGMLLFIDDLHWSDQGTISLLHYLLRNLRRERLWILAAYREIELDRAHPLAAALVDWNRERLAVRIALGRLERAGTHELLTTLFGQQTISDDFVDVIHRETEGNPFFIEEVIKALIEQGQIYREQERWQRKELNELAIPQSVKEAIGRRLNRLSAEATDVLHSAAALGKIFSFRELAAVCTVNEDTMLDALDEATTTQLIRADAGENFAFTHDKIREVLYEELNPIRRRRVHQRIGEGLEKLYGAADTAHVQDLAYHFAQSGDMERTLQYSLHAAENAERVFAHDEALNYFKQAREAAEALNRSEQLAALDENIGDQSRLMGQHLNAIAAYERALENVTTVMQRGALHVKMGEAYTTTGDRRGLPLLEQALQELDADAQPAAYAMALADIGRYHHYRTEHTRALEYLERARVLAEQSNDPETLAIIYGYLSGANQHLVEYATSDQWARANIELGERTYYPHAVALGNEFLAENAFGRGFWHEAIRYAELNRAMGERVGAQDRVAWALFSRAQGEYNLGQLHRAYATALAALEICDRLGENRLETWLQAILAIVQADLGNGAEAEAHATRGIELGHALNQIVLDCWTAHAYAYVLAQRDEMARAAKVSLAYVERAASSENLVVRSLTFGNAAQVLFRAGKVEQAAQILAEFERVVVYAGSLQGQGLAHRVHALQAALASQWANAENEFARALDFFEKIGSRLDAARTVYARGAMYQQLGQAEAARTDLERARTEFEKVGAAVDLKRANERLYG